MQKKPAAPPKAIAPQKRGGIVRPATRTGRTAARHSGREEVGNRLAWLVGGGLALVVVLLIGIGYYSTYIGPARNTAIVAGKRQISLGDYRDRLRAATLASDPNATQSDAFNKESSTTDALEEEQVYLQRAASLGVGVNDNDIATAMAKAVHAPVAGDPLKITDAATYETLLRNELQRDGLALDQERQIGRAAALKDKVQQKFKADVPKQALAVKATELIFATEQQGRAAQQRLSNGDTVADIAQDSVGDPSIGRAQPLDWTPVPFGILPTPLDDVAGKLTAGEVSDLIKVTPTTGSSAPQWYLLAITDRDPNHNISATQAQQIANQRSTTWLNDQKEALGVHSFVDASNATWAALHSGLPQTAKATPTPGAPLPGRPGSAPPPPGGPGGLGAPGAPGGPPAGPQPGAPAQPGAAPVGPPAPGNNQPVPNGTP